jgi:TonB family protein
VALAYRRLGLALAASALAHLAGLIAFAALPQGGRVEASPFGFLHVTLRPATDAGLDSLRAVRSKESARRGLPPAAHYHAAHELDQRPQIRSHVEPHFPALALAPVGRVVIQLYVSETGDVERVAVESGDPNGDFEAAARKAFAVARFVPGMKQGVAVKSLVRIEVLFGSPYPLEPGTR